MPTRHDPLVVLASYLIAAFASYVTLDLARRVRSEDTALSRLWWLGGSLAMGSGVWSMHFVAMLGFDAGIPLGYTPGATLLSWLAAVLAGGIALAVATRDRLSPALLAGGATAMATSICAMHYIGMAALVLAPGIAWNLPLVAASALVAWVASAAALAIFFMMRRFRGARRLRMQVAAALVMGLAIVGMHFTGMAAASVPAGAVCLSADGLRGLGLLGLVGVGTLLMLLAALVVSILDARRESGERRLRLSLQAANTELQSANAELQRMALCDPLTGLSNRMLLDDRLRHATARRGEDDSASSPLAVLVIDLDGFRPINDTYGHAIGDAVLREVAQRLRSIAREGDTLARIGGDEFVMVLEARDPTAAALRMAEAVITAMRDPFAAQGRGLALSCSVGIATHPEHGSAGELLVRADAARAAAKRAGGATWTVYANHMSDGAGEQVALQQALRSAVALGQLSLHFQPKVSADMTRISGLEALLRWRHPERGMVSPAVFVPVAERFGLIGGIGRWVIDEACAQLGRWNAAGVRCHVAINLSAHQLRQADLVETIAAAAERHAVSATQLVFEITETAMMQNLAEERAVLERLAALGARISIDDFGTGYSSLAYLRSLPARQLKVDRSLVMDIDRSDEARAVMAAIVGLAHALRLEVVAEGVETATQAQVLRELDCDLLQGWLVARPMPADAVLPWIAQHAAAAPRTAHAAQAQPA